MCSRLGSNAESKQPKLMRNTRCSRNDEVQVGGRSEVPHRRVVHGCGLVRRHHIIELAALHSSEQLQRHAME